MTQHILCDEPHLSLRLSELLSLEDAQLPAGAGAMRPLNQAHVQQFVASQMEHWPPILVTRGALGYIIVDGYHRREAARRKQADVIHAVCQSYPDEYAVVDAAFRANLTHGLQASFTTRGDYAFWLHQTFPALRQEQIAERVGLSQGAVSKAITKRERATQPEVPADSLASHHVAKQSTQRLIKVALHFLQDVDDLSDEEVLEVLTSEDRAKLARLARLLGETPAGSGQPRQFLAPQGQFRDARSLF